jgi:hypothetical protein
MQLPPVLSAFSLILTLAPLGVAQAGVADATSHLTLSVKYKGPAGLLTVLPFGPGTKTLSGYGIHDETASGPESFADNVWSATLDATSFAESPPTSESDAAFEPGHGTVFSIFNDPTLPGAKAEQFTLTFSASAFLSAFAEGEFANAWAATDYRITWFFLGQTSSHFVPSLPLRVDAPPNQTLSYTREDSFLFNIIPGGRLIVNDDFAWVKTHAFTSEVPEPTTWALMLAGFGLAGAALRARRQRRPALT